MLYVIFTNDWHTIYQKKERLSSKRDKKKEKKKRFFILILFNEQITVIKVNIFILTNVKYLNVIGTC